MIYHLELRARPWNAIKAGTKKAEGRVPTPWEKTPLDQLKEEDILVFENDETKALLKCQVQFVHHYNIVREMLEHEGTLHVLSGGRNIEQGIESYHSIPNYQENTPKFGIYAIGVTPFPDTPQS